MWIWLQAIVGLSEETGGAFHIFNPKEISIQEILDACREIQTVGRREFERELEIAGTSSVHLMCRRLRKAWFSGEQRLPYDHGLQKDPGGTGKDRILLAKAGSGDIKDMFYGKQR